MLYVLEFLVDTERPFHIHHGAVEVWPPSVLSKFIEQ